MNERKVTSDALREMALGETRVFVLPRQEPGLSQAANSGKTLAYRLQRELCCKFAATTDFDNATLTLTKNAQP